MDYAEALRKLYTFPARLNENYDGLLSDIKTLPQDAHNAVFSPTDGLLSDAMRVKIAQALANPPKPDPEMWIDRGLRISAIAPIWKTVEATDPQSLSNLLKNYAPKK